MLHRAATFFPALDFSFVPFLSAFLFPSFLSFAAVAGRPLQRYGDYKAYEGIVSEAKIAFFDIGKLLFSFVVVQFLRVNLTAITKFLVYLSFCVNSFVFFSVISFFHSVFSFCFHLPIFPSQATRRVA